MRAYGDLARALHAGLDPDTVAQALGLSRRVPAPQDEALPAAPEASPSRAPPPAEGLRERYWRLVAAETLDPRPPPPIVSAGLTPAEQAGEGSLWAVPRTPELAPWSTLEVALRRALARRALRGVDVDAVVRRVSRGEVLTHLPREAVERWPATLRVWMCRSRRHLSLVDDQHAVLRRLTAAVGAGRVRRRVIIEDTPDFPEDKLGDAPLLVLGDLGTTGARTAGWVALGERLAARGIRAVALSPTGGPVRGWHVVPWGPTRAGAAEARRLLTLMSAAGYVQLGLVRAMRLLLPEADGATELAALDAPEVVAADGAGLTLGGEALQRLRAELHRADPAADGAPRTVDAAVRRRLRDVMDTWRRGCLTELRHGETLAWAAYDATGAPGDVVAAGDFFTRLEPELRGGGDPGWIHFLRVFTSSLPAVPPGAVGAVIERLAARVSPPDTRPVWVSAAAVAEAEGDTTPRRWEVREMGPALRLFPAEAWRPDAPLRPGSPVAELVAGARVVGRGAHHPLGALTPGVEVAAEHTLVLESPQQRLRLERWTPDASCVAAGRDAFGLWADHRLGEVTWRMRWIPPGRFWMGSPDDEAGRFDNEARREVELTEGLWLGDTPVTQALWEAVVGNNPSRFKTPGRPVEQVSWDETNAFCTALDRRIPGFGARLPTEAEWERACRAGTEGATWLGRLEIRGMNDAPGLDAIAWYGGNSGVEFDIPARGFNSSGWPEKQHPHTRAGSREVNGKAPNPWGLYDMLGNVYEWCADPYEMGSDRVLRGGSWTSDARDVRAASRGGFPPGDRYGSLGFRLARGPAPGGGAQVGPGPEAPARGAAQSPEATKRATRGRGRS